jgi:glycosyltransferase involved in cell wall biosynthesis
LIEGDPGTQRFLPPADRSSGVDIDQYSFIGPWVDSRTKKRVVDLGPDLVHCYEPRTAPLSAALQLSRLSGARLCVRFADDDELLAREAGGSGIRGKLGRPLMLALGMLFPRLWPYKNPLLYRRMLREEASFDAITSTLAETIAHRYGVECRSILPAVPATEQPRADPSVRQRLRLPQSDRLVVYTGSVFRPHFDDFALLLRAFGLLAGQDESAHLVLAGRMAPRYRAQEEQLRRLAGAGADRIHFLGFVEDPSNLRSLMLEASVLVQPGAPSEFNRYRLPAKVHDYLLTGRPVVTFAAGFGALLRDRVDAALTHSGEPEELGAALAWVLADADRAEAIGESGRRRALELFDPAKIASQTLDYYRDALAATTR